MTALTGAQLIARLAAKKGVSQQDVEDTFQKWIDENRSMDSQIIWAMERLIRGGDCILCGTPFKKIDVSAMEGTVNFSYYEPGCVGVCFKRCWSAGIMVGKTMYRRPGCERIRIEEKLLGYKQCLNCGGIIL